MNSLAFTPSRLLPTVLSAAMLVLGAHAGHAHAATVSSETHSLFTHKGEPTQFASSTRYVAAPGEENHLTIRRQDGPNVFTELALPIVAGQDCQQRAPGVAVCPGGATSVSLADGNDQADSDAAVTVDGGPGNDVLTGAGALTGGAGDDTLTGTSRMSGGPGQDTLTGRPVADGVPGGSGTSQFPMLVDGGQGEHDTYIGAVRNDTVSYEDRSTPVRIALGQTTNEDTLVSIRSIMGGNGDDTISGDAQPNQLSGLGGADHLAGGGGDDILFGGSDRKADDLSGGPGNDVLVLSEGRDRLSCGPGTDELEAQPMSFATISVPAHCERASFRVAFSMRGQPVRRGRFVVFHVDRVEEAGGRITLRSGRRYLGFARPVKRRGTYRAVLNRTGRRLARAGRLVDVMITSSGRRRDDGTESAFRYRLR